MRGEPRSLAAVRYLVAILVAWTAFRWVVRLDVEQRMTEALASGDDDATLGDTGANAVALVFGWVPALAYAVLLGVVRRLWIWVADLARRRRQRRDPARPDGAAG